MPIIVQSDIADSSSGLPDRLLRPLILSRATETTDPDDGSIGLTWESEEFLGRITRGQTSEAGEDGRQAAVDGAKLLTNVAGIRFQDRILDDEDELDEAWEVYGQPVAVWGASAVHHYEAQLRRVQG